MTWFFWRSNSPLKRTTPDPTNPCSRATVLSALKESRKRSYVVDEEDDLELSLRPTKRLVISFLSLKAGVHREHSQIHKLYTSVYDNDSLA